MCMSVCRAFACLPVCLPASTHRKVNKVIRDKLLTLLTLAKLTKLTFCLVNFVNFDSFLCHVAVAGCLVRGFN